MINPLRFPLVLFAILVGLGLFVHRHSSRHASPASTMVEQEDDDSLRLRKTSGLHLTADVRSTAITSPPLTSAAAILPLVPDQRPRALMRPGSRQAGDLSPLPSNPAGAPQELTSILAAAPPAQRALRPVESRPVTPLPPPEELASSHFLPRNSGPAAIQMHRIVDGDTLRDLAARYLGDENRYLEIYEANRDLLRQPDLLPLGSKLRIPRP